MRRSLPFLLAIWIMASTSAAEGPVHHLQSTAPDEITAPSNQTEQDDGAAAIARLHRRLDFLEKVARESHQSLIEMENDLARGIGSLLALSVLLLVTTLTTLVACLRGFARIGAAAPPKTAAKQSSSTDVEVASRPPELESSLEGAAGSGPEEPVRRAVERSPVVPLPPVRPAPASRVFDESDDMMRSLAALPHGRVAMLLHRLRHEGPKLAEMLASPRLRERFHQELLDPLPSRVLRFMDACEQGEAAVRDRWVEPDLLATLDTLGRCLSEAIQEGRNGHPESKKLAEELRAWLYRRFDKACRDEGWFGISAVLPYQTRFDPAVHHAVGGREVREAAGFVIFVQSIGLIQPREETLQRKAEVIVGR